MTADAAPDAYAIFARARAAVTAARYPTAIDYTIAVSGLNGATPQTNHYRAESRPYENEIRVAPVSSEEAAAPPHVVHGINFALSFFICGGQCDTGSATVKAPVGRAASSPDLLGVPLLDPTYAFGLPYASRARAHATVADSTLPVIATVSTRTRDYAVTFAGTDEVDGTPAYHLRLTPLRKPHDNRLRELWVGVADALPRRAVISGNFTVAPLVDVPWTIDFRVAGGVPFIARETASRDLYLSHRRVVRDAVIAFDDVREPPLSAVGRPLLQPDADDTTLVEPPG